MVRTAVVVLLISASILAGCVQEDEIPDTDVDSDDADDSQGPGSLSGTVLTIHLDPVKDGRVQLVRDGALVVQTTTNDQGEYSIQGIEPGDYVLQINAPCCREAVQAVTVAEEEATSVSVQLDVLSDDDLKKPYVEEFKWTGFLACGVTLVVITGEPCADVDDSSDFLHKFELREGLKTVSIGMVWDAAGGVLGEELAIFMERDGCGLSCADNETYVQAGGPPPLYARADNPGGDLSYEDIEGSRTVQFRVFPEFGVDFYYQQEFTVYYHLHYHRAAPEDYDPIPDL